MESSEVAANEGTEAREIPSREITTRRASLRTLEPPKPILARIFFLLRRLLKKLISELFFSSLELFVQLGGNFTPRSFGVAKNWVRFVILK